MEEIISPNDEQGRRGSPPSSLEQHVYELIKHDILSGHLHRGEPLVEARLAQEFGVSKTPVREALIRLRLDGLVSIERFRGARVANPSLRDVRETVELRRWIESGIADRIAEERPPDILARLRKNIKESKLALRQGKEEEYLTAIREFDDILAAGTGNALAYRLLRDLYNIFGLIAVSTLPAPDRRQRSINEHVRIVDAIAAGDRRRAIEATIAHVDSLEQDYISQAEIEGDMERVEGHSAGVPSY
jgi:DNA-binding GntR family transcriptional regulator